MVVPLAKLLGLPSLGRPDDTLVLILDIREWKNDFQRLGDSLGISALSVACGGGGGGSICAACDAGSCGRGSCSSEYFAMGIGGRAMFGGWNCCSVADLWWLVAGLRSVLEPRLVSVPWCAGVAGVLLTSLLGGSCCGTGPVGERIGAPEPCENDIDGESGPTLDRGLPCWESGRIDSRFIHEPFDDTESRMSSAMAG